MGYVAMKAYALDLREGVVKFLNAGGAKAEEARRQQTQTSTQKKRAG